MNDFREDPTCLAVWRFDSDTLYADVQGANHWLAQGDPALESSDRREGDACLRLSANQGQYLYLPDGLPAEGFPLGAGDRTKTLTFCVWLKTFDQGEQVLWHRGDGSRLSLSAGIRQGYLWVEWGCGSGSETEAYCTYRICPQQWYHLSLLIDGVKRHLRVILYRESHRSWQACSFRPRNELWTGEGVWYLGAAPDGRFWDGLVDEGVLFGAMKDQEDCRQIAHGLFGGKLLRAQRPLLPPVPPGWRWNQNYWR